MNILSKQIRDHRTFINTFIGRYISKLRSCFRTSFNTFPSALISEITIWTWSYTGVIHIIWILLWSRWTNGYANLFRGISIIPFWTIFDTWRINVIKIENSRSCSTIWNTNILRLLAIKSIRAYPNTLLWDSISISIIRCSWGLRAILNTCFSLVVSI